MQSIGCLVDCKDVLIKSYLKTSKQRHNYDIKLTQPLHNKRISHTVESSIFSLSIFLYFGLEMFFL